jgi:phage-related protein
MAAFPSINPSYSVIEIPTFNTTIITYQRKVEQRIANFDSPQYRFKLHWKALSDADKTTLQDFFIARLGAYESFTWTHVKTSVAYTCRFAEDLATFEAFYYNLWSLNEVELIQVPA